MQIAIITTSSPPVQHGRTHRRTERRQQPAIRRQLQARVTFAAGKPSATAGVCTKRADLAGCHEKRTSY